MILGIGTDLANIDRIAGALGGVNLQFMQSNGGLKGASMFQGKDAILSGPAGGIVGAVRTAEQAGFDKVITFDMGGTSTDVAHYENAYERVFETVVAGVRMQAPMLLIHTVAAGGGSLCQFDGARFRVGPESADSDPGPASYGLGGVAPTVTDADLLLGRLNPENFAGGSIRLNVENASKALDSVIGSKLGFKTSHTALGVSEIVDENMSNAARVHAIESGVDIETYTIVAFGGAAPIHVARLAEKLNIQKIVIPPGAGVGSALGFLQAPVSYEVIRSYYQRLDDLDYHGINQLLHSMRKEATDVVEPGAQGQRTREIRTAFMRYIGQGHEVSVEIPVKLEEAELDSQSSGRLTIAFETEYTRLYGRTIPSLEIEILTWSLLVSTKESDGLAINMSAKSYAPDTTEFRKLMDAESGEFNDAAVYDRLSLAPGAKIEGPAIVTESDTATVITRRFEGQVTDGGYMIFERKNSK